MGKGKKEETNASIIGRAREISEAEAIKLAFESDKDVRLREAEKFRHILESLRNENLFDKSENGSPEIEDENNHSEDSDANMEYRVLVVDDSLITLKLMRRYLSQGPYVVETAIDGETALNLINKSPEFDLVILDVMMPGLNGIEVCRKIREKYSLFELPVLFLTALKETEDIVRGFEAGANDYLSKPFNIEELLARTKTLIKIKRLTRSNTILHEAMLIKNMFVKKLQREIEEREKVEKQLIEAKELADTANRLKSDFVANMSHEIRTPMNSILGFSELLKDSIKLEKNKDYLDAIISSGKNLMTLINDILDLSKIEADRIELQFEAVDIRKLFREVYQIFTLKANEKNLDYKFGIADNLPEELIMDEARIRQIMLNLIGNAVKFTDEGYVRIDISAVDPDEKKKQTGLMIEVSDSGIGIHEEEKELIFEAFRQQSGQSIKSYGGTGLGLTITKRLVEMMGGRIEVESEYQKGSVFRINLPGISIAESSEEIVSQKIDNSDQIRFTGATVLIAEADKQSRKLLREFLAGRNLDIIESTEGIETLEKILQVQPDIALLDMRLPGLDGFQCIKKIKSTPEISEIPIVGLTSLVMESDLRKIEESGFDSYIKKPLLKKDLIEELKKHLDWSVAKSEIDSAQDKGIIDNDLLPETVQMLPELIDRLENDLMRTRNRIQRSRRIKAVKEFAGRIKQIGRTYKISVVEDYGDALLRHGSRFDQKRIMEELDSYEALVERVKVIYEDNME